MMKEEDNYKPQSARLFASRQNRFENDVCSVEYIVTNKSIVDRLLDGNLRNRRLNAGHMKKLSIDIRNGRYVFTGQPVIRDQNGYLRDGQHRLIAIKEAGYPAIPLSTQQSLQRQESLCVTMRFQLRRNTMQTTLSIGSATMRLIGGLNR